MITISNLSEQDVEKIAYETAYLVKHGQTKIPFTNTIFFLNLKNSGNKYIEDIGMVWVKSGFQREIWYEHFTNKIIADWFDRESAFFAQQES